MHTNYSVSPRATCSFPVLHYRAAGERERGELAAAALGDRKEAAARDDVLGEDSTADAAPADGDRESVASRRGGLSGVAAADDRR